MMILTALCVVSYSQTAQAETFTATASGNWTSTATWGASAPGGTISAGDIVIIPSGITVNLDTDVEVDAALSTITVNGQLAGTSNLTITDGNLLGTGTINIDDLTVGSSGLVGFTGDISATNIFTSSSTLLLSGSFSVDNVFQLSSGAISLESGGSLDLASNATVIISGGFFNLNGGVVTGGSYNVTYDGSSVVGGAELSGSGLNNVMIDLNSSSTTVSLGSDVEINGTLNLNQGELDLDGNSLTLNGDLMTTANASFAGSSSSDLTINGSGDVTGALMFSAGSEMLNDFEVNLTSSGNVDLGSDLEVTGDLTLTNGTLTVGDNMLTISGDISASGNGELMVDGTSDIMVNSSSDVSGMLSFSGSSTTMGDLTIDISNGGNVDLGSDVDVSGTLTLTNGTLTVGTNTLTITGDVAATGSGSLAVNDNSSIEIMTTGSITGALSFDGSANTVNDLTIDVGSSGNVDLEGDLEVSGMLTLSNGTLTVGDNMLTLSGDLDGSGSGMLSVDGNSSIMIATSSDVSGALMFDASGNAVGDLTINISDGGDVDLGTDLTVEGTLTLTNGTITIADNDLAIGGSGSISGGSTDSYVVTNGEGNLMMEVTAGGAGMSFPVGTETNFAPAIVTQGSAGASGEFMVHVAQGVLADGNSGVNAADFHSVVNATWFVESALSADIDATLEVWWSADMEVNGFNSDSAYISHYVNGEWDTDAAATATVTGNGMLSISRDNINSLSPFSVADKDAALAVEEADIAGMLEFYPNPVFNQLNFRLPDNADAELSTVEVYNLQGQIINTVNLAETQTLDVSSYNEGIYFIRVANSANGFVGKFVKQ